ncbi:MAG TPA: MFS transporter, partial [Gaiellaceae bacterium]|nr:MFS transporter [Gaiellaceae bacterium]
MRSALTRMSQSAGALAAVFRNRDLRRLELAWVGSIIGSWAYLVALAVYAYGEGGAAAVGLVGVIRLLPSALAAPFVAVAADRFPRERVMVVTDLIRVPLMVLVAVTIYWDGPAAIVYAAVGLASIVGTAFRPAQAALLPSLARTPEELSAANVTSSTVESIGTFVGPALGGILLAATNPEIVFGVNALTFVWSALMVAGIRAVAHEPAEPADRGSFRREVGAGFRTFAVERDLRLIVILYGAQTIVAGAFTVLMVVASLELLDMGEAGFGFLNSAVGIGGFAGALLALALAMRGRLATDFALGVALYGAPLALVVVWQEPLAALVLMALVGVGNTLTDVAALTLMQRAVPDEVLA